MSSTGKSKTEFTTQQLNIAIVLFLHMALGGVPVGLKMGMRRA